MLKNLQFLSIGELGVNLVLYLPAQWHIYFFLINKKPAHEQSSCRNSPGAVVTQPLQSVVGFLLCLIISPEMNKEAQHS